VVGCGDLVPVPDSRFRPDDRAAAPRGRTAVPGECRIGLRRGACTGEDWPVTDSDRDAGAAGRWPGQAEADSWRAMAEAEARRAFDTHPDLVTAGVVYTCLEEVDRRWRVVASDFETPQDARNGLAHIFLKTAVESADDATAAWFRAAAELLDWERRDEMTVAGCRFRVGRIERSARTGPAGPEPPRCSDPQSLPGAEHDTPGRTLGFIHANVQIGTAAAMMRYVLHNRVPECDTDDARRDAVHALRTHPRIALLPAEFVVAEEVDGRWRPRAGTAYPTVGIARDSLADYFRVVVPGPDSPEPRYARIAAELGYESPGPAVCEEFARAADTVVRDRLDDVHVAGEHFRIVRVEQIVRLGRDGPEPPRPSDPDPYLPPAALTQGFDQPGS
jgi:uncharacterized protein DUF5954